MIGIDALRWDAIDRYDAPTLQKLAIEGVRAEFMTPVMPSLTFVNFYALATGLYADSTEITANMPYSKEHDAVMGRKMHGYDRFAQDMQATFIAAGPSFKKGVKAKVIENVEVYGIIARALGLEPVKTDGN